MKNQISFFLSLISLSISLVTLALFFIKIRNSSIVDSGTFIGVIGAFIGIAVTLLIGYQILNVIDFRNKLSKIEELKEELENQKNELLKQSLQQNEGFSIIMARLYHKDCMQSCNALLSLMEAIPYSLSQPEKFKGYKYLLDELESYMMDILLNSFGNGTPNHFKAKVAEFKEIFNPIDQSIRNHKNFIFIEERYIPLLKSFNKRLDNISSFNNVSLTDMEGFTPLK